MYHFPNQPLFHHNGYQNQQCPLFHHVHVQDETPPPPPPPPVGQPQPQPYLQGTHYNAIPHTVIQPQEKPAPRQVLAHQAEETVNTKKKLSNKSAVDTSSFSIEERLVAAVWVHERKRTRSSMSQIKQEFRERFGREPPAKNTLLVWERKLFSTGSVCDAPRPGRPVNRCGRVEEVAASLRGAPALSLRARAAALRVPRTTLRTILLNDLKHATNKNTGATCKTARKQQPKRRVKGQVARRLQPQRCASHPHPPLPAAQHYSTHTHTHTAHGYT